uniref:NAC domain-containing protein n=1 Tax=Oryza barthii TaxID=65489 RepID=A0A0D3HTS2_9ORYZ
MEKGKLDFLLELGFRFNPSPEQVVTYYLPCLVAGQQPKDTEGCIHSADVYGADEPRDLAGKYAPVARSSNGHRFFFTGCRRMKGKFSRSAGGGTWVSQSSKDLKNREGIKIGEVKNFRFKKDGKNTDWLMEEYHLCGQESGDVVEPVVCRIYVSPRAAPDSVAHQESAVLQPQEPAPLPVPAAPAPPRQVPVVTQQAPPPPPPLVPVITQDAPPLKRPAPVAAPPCAKKMRGDVSAFPVVRQSCVAAPRCAPRVVAPPPRHPPIQTYPTDPFESAPLDPFEPPPAAASVTGGHHTPQPSVPVPATPEQGLSLAASNSPELDPANIGIDMDELMRYLGNTPLDGVLPSQLFVLPTNDDEDVELAKVLHRNTRRRRKGRQWQSTAVCDSSSSSSATGILARHGATAASSTHPDLSKDPFEPNDDEDEDENDFASMLRRRVFAPSVAEEVDFGGM